ncbi:MAG: alpha/beta fold hydrolase [Tepidiformaceae bacterium]
MTSAPIVLVPGFWLGGWAWDEVAAGLRADGHEVTAVTLPGLESADADRSAITLADHVDAICEAVRAADAKVVLAVNSGAGFSGYAASDRVPERIAAMVYVDSAPGIGALDPDFDGAEKPLHWEEIAEEENLDGLSEEQLETFRQRAVPEPGGVLRDAVALTNDERRDIPSTIICTGFPSEQVEAAAKEHNWAWLGGLAELRDVTWVDLPTSHWPMWSRPRELAEIIGTVARADTRGRPMTTSLLSDAFAHHIRATERLIDTALTSFVLTPPEIDFWSFGEATGRTRPVYL